MRTDVHGLVDDDLDADLLGVPSSRPKPQQRRVFPKPPTARKGDVVIVEDDEGDDDE